MGAFLDKPKTEKHTVYEEAGPIRVGLTSMQGWRIEQEVRISLCFRHVVEGLTMFMTNH